MPLTSHLEELRKRLIHGVLAYVVAVVPCMLYADRLFDFLKWPLTQALDKVEGASVAGTFAIRSLSEGFFVELKVALIAALFVASPLLFYQMWKFISPGLFQHERRLALPILVSATVLFSTGAYFGYRVVFPPAFDFFLSYTGGDTAAVLSISDYLDFTAKLLVGFGIVFELPLVIFILSWLGIVNHRQLREARKYVIVGNFVVASIITPPDIISQIGVGVPMILLYELGIWLSWLVGRKRRTDAEVLGEGAKKDS